MATIKGPALFLAQFVQDTPPFNTLESITRWAKDLGFLGLQIPVTISQVGSRMKRRTARYWALKHEEEKS